ncbi:MAG: single-stranded DNA-binding protein [Tepidisphaerales bacterium]
MASYNKVLLMGNLTRDPELSYTPSNVPVCKFALAVNRRYRTKSGEDREDTLYVDCTAFERKAELINQYLTKGRPVFVEGQLKMDTWEDKSTGQKRSKLYVIVENFQFLGGREGPGGTTGAAAFTEDDPAPPPARGPQNPSYRNPPSGPGGGNRGNAQRPAPPFAEDSQIRDEDIPF